MKQTVQARLLGMAESEILDYVPTRMYLDIKKKDPLPLFKAFVVGGEGTWKPTLVGIGAVVQRWFKSAVQKIVALLDPWTPAFHLHATTNDQEGRAVIGRVVGRAEKEIDGVASALAIIYILPEYQGLNLDIASIEADVDIVAGPGELPVKDVNVLAITGIALGNSAVNKPAYPGATLLAAIQAFDGNPKPIPGGNGKMTKEEIIAALKEQRLNPSDVFQPTQIIGDPIVVEHVKEKTVGEYAHRMRTDEAFQKATADWEKEKGALLQRAEKAEGVAIKVSAGEALKATLKERKLVDEAGKPKDERLIRFISKNYDKSFKPESEATLKKDLDKFLDGTVDDFKDLFGDQKPGAPGGGTNEPAPPAGAGAEGVDLTDPKNNPLIPQ